MTAPRLEKQLTEPQAWRLIAERIANGRWHKRGLCLEATHLFFEGLAERKVYYAMVARVATHRTITSEVASRPYAFPKGEAPVRILAALFLALEAEDE